MRILGSKTFQYQVEKKQTMHSVSSGERTRRRLNPTSLIAAQLSYVGQAYPLLEEGLPYKARYAVTSDVGCCKMEMCYL